MVTMITSQKKIRKGIKHVKRFVQSWYLNKPKKWHLRYKLGTNAIKM